MNRRRVLILGLGNTVLSDDGVGVFAARAIAEEARALGIDVAEAEVAGFALIDLLSGYDAAVVIDAVRLPGLAPGQTVIVDAESMPPSLHLVAGHQVDLPTALVLGREVGADVPDTVQVIGVQVLDDTTFSEEPTPEIAAAIPAAARTALELAVAALEGGR